MRTNFHYGIFSACIVIAQACGGPAQPAAQGAQPPEPAASQAPTSAVKPEREKVVTHLRDHVQYPVSRSALLEACAGTNEFSAEERKWFEDSVPDRTFSSSDEVLAALGM